MIGQACRGQYHDRESMYWLTHERAHIYRRPHERAKSNVHWEESGSSFNNCTHIRYNKLKITVVDVNLTTM